MLKLNDEQLNQIVGILNGLPISEIKRVEAIINILNNGEREQVEDSETETKEIAEN
jgi:hypothetical protein